MPANNGAAGLPAAASISGNNVTSVTVASSTITIRYSNDANITGDDLVLKANTMGGSVDWDCGFTGTTVEDKYLPSNCR